jgi:hypothetical protein
VKTKNVSLTFFIQKMKNIFESINNIGLNKDYDKNNMYQVCNGIDADFMSYSDIDQNYFNIIQNEYRKKIYSLKKLIYLKETALVPDERDKLSYLTFKDNFSKYIMTKAINNRYIGVSLEGDFISDLEKQENEAREKQKDNPNIKFIPILDKFHVLFLSYTVDKSKIFKTKNINFVEKIAALSKNVLQSYSLMPRINPKTRNSNKQFFSQGNNDFLKEGTGDIIEFQVDEFNVDQFNALMVSNKNKKNIGFSNLINNNFKKGVYENAAKYYNTYIDIDGKIDTNKIVKQIADLEIAYQNQTDIKASVTIIGEPYWSDSVNSNKFIYLNIYYNNGNQSNHSGLYTVRNITQIIDNGKFTTKIDVLRVPTFLNNFNLANNTDINSYLRL